MGSIWSGSVSFCPLPLLFRFGLSRFEYRYGLFWADTIAVIVLIAAEILVAAVNIVVDLYAGVD